MNIFVLDLDHTTNATYHVDRHVGKMALEAAQMMSTAHHMLGGNTRSVYKPISNPGHGSAVWVRSSSSNYEWMYQLYLALNWEHVHRFGTSHGCVEKAVALRNVPPLVPHGPMTPFYLAFGDYRDRCMISTDPVECYREYYRIAKVHLHKWKRRTQPSWLLNPGINI